MHLAEEEAFIASRAVVLFVDFINARRVHKPDAGGYANGVATLVRQLNGVLDHLAKEAAISIEIHVVGDGALVIFPGDVSGNVLNFADKLMTYCVTNEFIRGDAGFAMAIAMGDIYRDDHGPVSTSASGIPNFFGTAIDQAAYLIANAKAGQIVVAVDSFPVTAWDMLCVQNYCGQKSVLDRQQRVEVALYSVTKSDDFTLLVDRINVARKQIRVAIADTKQGLMGLTNELTSPGDLESGVRLHSELWHAWIAKDLSKGKRPLFRAFEHLTQFLRERQRRRLADFTGIAFNMLPTPAAIDLLPEARTLGAAADAVFDAFEALVSAYATFPSAWVNAASAVEKTSIQEALIRSAKFPLEARLDELEETLPG